MEYKVNIVLTVASGTDAETVKNKIKTIFAGQIDHPKVLDAFISVNMDSPVTEQIKSREPVE